MDPRSILLVEDNPDDIELTRRALVSNNISNTLVVAEDGVAALELLENAGKVEPYGLPAVVLLDISLPRMNGLEVLRRIRENPATRLVPVVILTTSKEEQDLAAGYKLGANSFVRKPVEFEQFMEAVAKLGMYWLLLNEDPPRAR